MEVMHACKNSQSFKGFLKRWLSLKLNSELSLCYQVTVPVSKKCLELFVVLWFNFTSLNSGFSNWKVHQSIRVRRWMRRKGSYYTGKGLAQICIVFIVLKKIFWPDLSLIENLSLISHSCKKNYLSWLNFLLNFQLFFISHHKMADLFWKVNHELLLVILWNWKSWIIKNMLNIFCWYFSP